MKPGTLVRLPDGREGRVVYHSLDGIGIRWGTDALSSEQVEAIMGGNGGLFRGAESEIEKSVTPEAMLRHPYEHASLPCVGPHYEVVEEE